MLIIVGLSWIMVKFTARPNINHSNQHTSGASLCGFRQSHFPLLTKKRSTEYSPLVCESFPADNSPNSSDSLSPTTQATKPAIHYSLRGFQSFGGRLCRSILCKQDSAPQIFILSAQFFSLLCTLFPCMYYAFQWKLWGEWVDYLKILWSGLELARNPRSSAKIVSSSVTKPFSGDFIALPLRACPKR